MAKALRSTVIVDNGVTLEICECADRETVQLVFEDATVPDADGRYLILDAAEWHRLVTLPFLVDEGPRTERSAQPPAGVRKTLTLIDGSHTLEIRESPDGHCVQMCARGCNREELREVILITLNAEQWQHLCGLDYVHCFDPASPFLGHRQPPHLIH
jgi:hypothetical protein